MTILVVGEVIRLSFGYNGGGGVDVGLILRVALSQENGELSAVKGVVAIAPFTESMP